MKLVVQIPCYNEADSLARVIAEIPAEIAGIDTVSVLVIDDGSSDATSQVARDAGAEVVRHSTNRGLAQAFVTGIEAALQMEADIIVNTDGDHQYPGEYIPALVSPLVRGRADLVIGNRQPARDPNVPARKKFFYRVGNTVVRSVTGVDIHDAPSGFRAMSRDFALRVFLTNPFSYTIETIFSAAEARCLVLEIPIRPNRPRRPSRLFGSLSEYITRSAQIIVQGYSMHKPLRAFAWLSLPFLLLGVAIAARFLYYFVQDPSRSGHIQSLILAAVAVVVGAQIFLFGMLGSLVRTNRLLLQDIRLRMRRLELERGRPPRPEAGDDTSPTVVVEPESER